MEKVDVTISIPKAEKDLVDAVVLFVTDLKAKKGMSALVGDAIPAFMKISAEYSELSAEMKSPESAEAVIYLENELAKLFIPSIVPAAPSA